MSRIFSKNQQLFLSIKYLNCDLLTSRSLSKNVKPSIISNYNPIIMPNVSSLDEGVFEKSHKFHKKIALECGVTGRCYTYDDLFVKTRNFNNALRKLLKLKYRDVIALIIPNIPEFAIVTLGSIQAGLICTTLNPIYTPDEIARQLKDSNAKALITIPELWQNSTEALKLLQIKLPIICIKTQDGMSLPEGAINFFELINQEHDIRDAGQNNLDDIISMPYSSGTTGLPKGVLLTNKNILSAVLQTTTDEIDILHEANDNFQDVSAAILPMFHIYGFLTLMNGLRLGAKIVTLPKFTPDLYINTLKKYKPTLLLVVPPIIIHLTNNPNVKSEYMSNVRVVVSGAAPLGGDDEARFLDKMQCPMKVLQGYGLTECSTTTVTNPTSKHNVPGSVGMLVPCTEAKIVALEDNNFKNLGPNETGELLLKGPQIMKGYHNRPEETDKSFVDGWFRTGDMAYYNENNQFFITDRIKELIKVKGFQVPPAELEELIRGFDNVADCAVIGVPHKYHGEVPRAYVVPKKDTKVNVENLDKFVGSKVAEYKRLLGGVAIVDNIPKNASGKILRRQIKLEYMKAVNK